MKRDKDDEQIQKEIWYNEHINDLYYEENYLRNLWEVDSKKGAWALSEKQRQKLLKQMEEDGYDFNK